MKITESEYLDNILETQKGPTLYKYTERKSDMKESESQMCLVEVKGAQTMVKFFLYFNEKIYNTYAAVLAKHFESN